MQKALNIPRLEDALLRAGMNQSALATRLKVSREAVSNWLRGESFPQPDKLIRIGMLVGLTFDDLVQMPPQPADSIPVVTFRKKANRKTKDEHLDRARETGEHLKRLVKYLPAQELTQPPTLKDPCDEYAYIQRAAAQTRRDMGLEGKRVVDFMDLIAKFSSLHAILVPVLWGAREQHGNALNVYLPDSRTLWVFLNLDSNAIDFKFWMAHELGHALAPTFGGEPGEDFADGFAQAFLFPESLAKELQPQLVRVASVGARVERIRREASRLLISPYTIRLAIEAYEQFHGMPAVDLGPSSVYMAGVKNFGKGFKTIAAGLTGQETPGPDAYVGLGREPFQSPFFEILAGYCRDNRGAEHFIHRILGLPLADAKALSGELTR
jgi:transcriptional regulator with XRE-family HTH domain